jgi:hypothetical protein
MESRESLTLFTDRDASVRTEPNHSEIILASVQLLDLVNRERDGASIRLETLVDQGVYADSESMIRIALFLTRRELGG